ncbi:MAG TPA: histidinol phosphate phosphatase domain-containing protein [Candidatus Bathyarchaeota archaeon]|nr:histidinol phosphate phosphatase domain-containing protein [Candidatus Bathyarchaeota archaeon]
MNRRIELHIHTIYSDGTLTPYEVIYRYLRLRCRALAFTDHADMTNLDFIIERYKKLEILEEEVDIPIIKGVELTYIPPTIIPRAVRRARELGFELIVIHGESPVEPVPDGTNHMAVSAKGVDILAHPGFITVEDAEIAASNGVHLEITSRNGHSLTNGYIASICRKVGAKTVVNTDAHGPDDLIGYEDALKIALGAGLTQREAERAVNDYMWEIVEKILEERKR